jgi:hypothetical protein
MTVKFLITLLSSSNEKLLKLSYNTIINQYKHNLNYTIVIVVNTLDKSYFQKVQQEFENINIEIIETESNGKPGMGHNSLFKIFKSKTQYDYLISIDGDDFLYPYALHQLSKCFDVTENPDCVCIYGNDTIRDYQSDYDMSDIYITNHFYLRMGYNLPKKFSDSNMLFNIFNYNINKKQVQTIIRFIMCSRNFINKNTFDLYCEKSHILDDYKFYLNYLDNVLNKSINGLIINSDHIYLYNNINHNSISKVNHDKFSIDYNIIENYKNDFIYLLDKLGNNWDLSNFKYVNLSPVFNETFDIIDNSDNTFNINKEDIITKKNYTYIIDFVTDLVLKYYNICINNIENFLFDTNSTNIDKQKALDLCIFLTNNKIHDRKLFIYTAICYFYTNNIENTLYFIEKSDYMIHKFPVLLDFYNKNKKKNF